MSFDILQFLSHIADFTAGDYLRAVWGDAPWVTPTINALGVLIIATIPLLSIFIVGWVERKVLARMQDRIGPNRVGKFGLLQMFADVVKMMTKEMIVPAGADKVAYFAAPALGLITSVLLFAVMPFAPNVIGVDLNVGAFYVLAISSVSVVSLLLAGWGSNNKFALLGAFRAVAQLVSYEIPMILSLLIPILLARTMSMIGLVEAQAIPFFFYVPLSGLIFFISILAETGRSPFDLLEAESEIVAGFHTEYTGMNFGLFMASEYIAILFMSGLFVSAYWSGYRFFGLESLVLGNGFAIGNIFALLIVLTKMFLVFFMFMWLRGTLPRFRIDQLLDFNWKFMVPLTLALLFTVAILDKLLPVGLNEGVRASAHFVSNLIIGIITLEILRKKGRDKRKAHEKSLETAADEGQLATAVH